ncbi:MAG: hypothetical protein HOV66_11730, partial [Streptomycetaceae bacterium]|nr:hypothetical protein [Streptomycetaceae bacterium]
MQRDGQYLAGAELDGDALVRWGLRAVDDLSAHCATINDLNVFPIPDSDTGTNLHAT